MNKTESELRPNWPDWTSPQREIEVLRESLHDMASALIGALDDKFTAPSYWDGTVQGLVDYFVAGVRLGDRRRGSRI